MVDLNDWGSWYAPARTRCARVDPARRDETKTMSGISAITSPGASLAQLLSQSESGPASDSTDLDSLLASGLQNIESDGQSDATAADSTGSGTSSGLQGQVQSAISAAIDSAEQSGGSDLKTTVYNALVQVLTSNGIDPKTFQATDSSTGSGGDGSSSSVDSTTSSVLSQVLAAVSGASAATNPAAQLLAPQQGSQASSDPLSLLGGSSGGAGSLNQFLAPDNNTQASDDLDPLLAGTQGGAPANSLASFLGSQNNNQDLLGFLYDSGQ
jgi:hypothetical protein